MWVNPVMGRMISHRANDRGGKGEEKRIGSKAVARYRLTRTMKMVAIRWEVILRNMRLSRNRLLIDRFVDIGYF